MKKVITTLGILLLLSGQAWADKRYVTDRILLGVHTEADETSTVIKTVPSGTELEVIDSSDGFLQVRLDDGTEGWVNSGFVTKDTPSTRKYDVLAHQYEKTTQELDKLKADYAKKEREIEVRRDQISNANTTIRELKKKLQAGGGSVADPEIEAKLAASLKEVETLRAKLAELQAQPKEVVSMDEKKLLDEIKVLKQKNEQIQTRIDVAMAHLKGEKIPTEAELESIRPRFPGWYWTLLVVVLLLGMVAGYFLMDYLYRRRHGGFRL